MVGAAVTVTLCSIEEGIDYVHLDSCMASRWSAGRCLMEPRERHELPLKSAVRGGCRGAPHRQMGAD